MVSDQYGQVLGKRKKIFALTGVDRKLDPLVDHLLRLFKDLIFTRRRDGFLPEQMQFVQCEHAHQMADIPNGCEAGLGKCIPA